MNHLQGLEITVVSEQPSLKNFDKKENTMKYMTNQVLQRFMSHMATMLADIHMIREDLKEEIATTERPVSTLTYKTWKLWLRNDKETYIKNSKLQKKVKDGEITQATLQQMEKVVTNWIIVKEQDVWYTYEKYLMNRYDPFYRNKSKQAKQKLKKLVELQQAIRKQKSITRS
jgi:hypothetical protein